VTTSLYVTYAALFYETNLLLFTIIDAIYLCEKELGLVGSMNFHLDTFSLTGYAELEEKLLRYKIQETVTKHKYILFGRGYAIG